MRAELAKSLHDHAQTVHLRVRGDHEMTATELTAGRSAVGLVPMGVTPKPGGGARAAPGAGREGPALGLFRLAARASSSRKAASSAEDLAADACEGMRR